MTKLTLHESGKLFFQKKEKQKPADFRSNTKQGLNSLLELFLKVELYISIIIVVYVSNIRL